MNLVAKLPSKLSRYSEGSSRSLVEESAPSRETRVDVGYPWVAGESYEIGLLISTGAIVEYELEDAGETKLSS